MASKAKATKEKIDKLDFIKLKLVLQKTIKKIKDTHKMGEKYVQVLQVTRV